MNTAPLEILHNILQSVSRARDIAICMLVCSCWNDCIKYLNNKYARDCTLNSGITLLCKNIAYDKRRLSKQINAYPSQRDMLRLLFSKGHEHMIFNHAVEVEKLIKADLIHEWKCEIAHIYIEPLEGGIIHVTRKTGEYNTISKKRFVYFLGPTAHMISRSSCIKSEIQKKSPTPFGNTMIRHGFVTAAFKVADKYLI